MEWPPADFWMGWPPPHFYRAWTHHLLYGRRRNTKHQTQNPKPETPGGFHYVSIENIVLYYEIIVVLYYSIIVLYYYIIILIDYYILYLHTSRWNDHLHTTLLDGMTTYVHISRWNGHLRNSGRNGHLHTARWMTTFGLQPCSSIRCKRHRHLNKSSSANVHGGMGAACEPNRVFHRSLQKLASLPECVGRSWTSRHCCKWRVNGLRKCTFAGHRPAHLSWCTLCSFCDQWGHVFYNHLWLGIRISN